MQFLLSLLWFAILAGASYNAKLTEKSVAIDNLDLVPRSDFPAERVPENQCLSSFYHIDAARNMCGESTFANNLNYQCEHGTASLGDDCNALIQDLLAKGGGGFWGYTDESDVVIASHESCTFRITVQDSKDLFNIGVQDVIDLVTLALSQKGKCGDHDDVMVGVNGVLHCKYKSGSIQTTWIVTGPSQTCAGGGGRTLAS